MADDILVRPLNSSLWQERATVQNVPEEVGGLPQQLVSRARSQDRLYLHLGLGG